MLFEEKAAGPSTGLLSPGATSTAPRYDGSWATSSRTGAPYRSCYGAAGLRAATHGRFRARTTGHDLETYTWAAANGRVPVGVVVLVHGFGEHLGRYTHVANHFAERGLEVVGTDLAYHGLSEGMDGGAARLPSMDVLVDDLADFVEQAVVRDRGHLRGKRWIYTHGAGGLVAYLAMKRRLQEWRTWNLEGTANFGGIIYSVRVLWVGWGSSWV